MVVSVTYVTRSRTFTVQTDYRLYHVLFLLSSGFGKIMLQSMPIYEKSFLFLVAFRCQSVI